MAKSSNVIGCKLISPEKCVIFLEGATEPVKLKEVEFIIDNKLASVQATVRKKKDKEKRKYKFDKIVLTGPEALIQQIMKDLDIAIVPKKNGSKKKKNAGSTKRTKADSTASRKRTKAGAGKVSPKEKETAGTGVKKNK